MDITTQNLDHMGLVAGMCDEIGIVDIIDSACGDQAKNKNLTFGQAVKCMILNGLGFVSRTLYLYSEYFEDKPIDLLLGVPVIAEQVDDNLLGRALDKLFSLGVTELYTKIALQATKVLGIQVKSLHLDSTSFHVDGEYNSLLEQDESRIRLVPGYSRDHRPDLNQVVLQLITSSQGNLPLFMQAASGNTSDKQAFAAIVSEHIKSFQEAVSNKYLVGDSALYTPKTLQSLHQAGSKFVTRVPMQIQLAKDLVAQAHHPKMFNLENGYRYSEHTSSYGDVDQRWIVFFSEAAFKRESQTLQKRLRKGSEEELKEFQDLMREEFSCPRDAQKHLDGFAKKLKYTDVIDGQIVGIQKHAKVGRPKRGEAATTVGYKIQGQMGSSLKKKTHLESTKGYFILSTNDLEKNAFPAQEVLLTYKAQQSVERGFRFLKSPDFLVSSFFLKKPERIEALLMVMTLCLLVYSAIEHKARQKLAEIGEHFLNQKKKPSQRPTARWIFFCFLGLHVLNVEGVRKRVLNLKQRHEIMLRCLGPPYQKFYYSAMW